MSSFSTTRRQPPASLALLLSLAAAAAACSGAESRGVAGSVSLAIDADYLFAVEGERVFRYDRATAAVDALDAPDHYGYGANHVGLNATRVFFPTQDGGLSSISRDGGEARVESETAPSGCFAGCTALTDDTLYVLAGSDAELAELVVVDLAAGTSSTRDAPWAISIALTQDTLFGMSCYDVWSVPREGGAVTSALQADIWGEERVPDCAGSLVADDSWLYYSGRDGVSRTTHEWTDREVLAADQTGGGPSLFAVRDGQLYVADDGAIRQVTDQQDEVLVEAPDIAGIAVGGDTLYWTQRTPSGALDFFELKID